METQSQSFPVVRTYGRDKPCMWPFAIALKNLLSRPQGELGRCCSMIGTIQQSIQWDWHVAGQNLGPPRLGGPWSSENKLDIDKSHIKIWRKPYFCQTALQLLCRFSIWSFSIFTTTTKYKYNEWRQWWYKFNVKSQNARIKRIYYKWTKVRRYITVENSFELSQNHVERCSVVLVWTVWVAVPTQRYIKQEGAVIGVHTESVLSWQNHTALTTTQIYQMTLTALGSAPLPVCIGHSTLYPVRTW
jgi:hypothetical protein